MTQPPATSITASGYAAADANLRKKYLNRGFRACIRVNQYFVFTAEIYGTIIPNWQTTSHHVKCVNLIFKYCTVTGLRSPNWKMDHVDSAKLKWCNYHFVDIFIALLT